MRERGRFFHKPIWRQDSPEYLCIPNIGQIVHGHSDTPLNEEEIILGEVWKKEEVF